MADSNRLRKSRSSSADPNSNEEIQIWSQLCHALWDLKAKMDEAQPQVGRYNRVNLKIASRGQEGKEFNSSAKAKISGVYEKTNGVLDDERNALALVMQHLEILSALRDATENGTDKHERRKKRKIDEKPPRGSPAPIKKAKGSMESSVDRILPAEHQVVVRPAGQDWMLGVVKRWLPDKGKYEIEDAEDDEFMPGAKRKRFLFPAQAVVPIPSPIEVTRRPVFHKGVEVLALFPGTSCFYQAKVETPSSKGGDYVLKFVDDEDHSRLVAPKFVLSMPKIPEQ
ncbi:SGF29 tudor-like domain-containing protein [Phlyctochytrium arcticum]|nr:SGF29 tudor-like domain-containing protein [Phlyctochytrium arcticum]